MGQILTVIIHGGFNTCTVIIDTVKVEIRYGCHYDVTTIAKY